MKKINREEILASVQNFINSCYANGVDNDQIKEMILEMIEDYIIKHEAKTMEEVNLVRNEIMYCVEEAVKNAGETKQFYESKEELLGDNTTQWIESIFPNKESER